MPATWAEVTGQLGYGIVAPTSAKYAIPAAAFYMANLRAQWDVADLEKHFFALGAYNAGGGNIRRARRACGAMTWEETTLCLPDITGPEHSAETTGYIVKVKKWFAMMAFGA